MYRAPNVSVRCVSCGGTAVTDETKLDPSDGWLKVHFSVQPRFQTTNPVETYIVGRARVCLDCGHVSVALGAKELERLRHQLPALQPIVEQR